MWCRQAPPPLKSLSSWDFLNTHREGLDTPNDNILLRHILGTAHTGLEAWGICIAGYGHRYFHAIGH